VDADRLYAGLLAEMGERESSAAGPSRHAGGAVK
jgi:hypothetical protein